MGLTIDDLQPKDFTINLNGVELTCKPLKLSHTLALASVGSILDNINNASIEEIKRVEKNVYAVIPEIIPELTGKTLDGNTILNIITQVMTASQPSEIEFLEKNGVKIDSDPKAQKVG